MIIGVLKKTPSKEQRREGAALPIPRFPSCKNVHNIINSPCRLVTPGPWPRASVSSEPTNLRAAAALAVSAGRRESYFQPALRVSQTARWRRPPMEAPAPGFQERRRLRPVASEKLDCISKTFLCTIWKRLRRLTSSWFRRLNQLFAFLVLISHERRRLLWFAVTRNPTAECAPDHRSVPVGQRTEISHSRQ
jgi:hypothetical protein